MDLGPRRRRHMSPPRRNGAPHRDDIASGEHGPRSHAPPSARSLVSRIGQRYSGRAPPTGPSFETALSAVGHRSIHHAEHPDQAPAAPTAAPSDSTALYSVQVALPTSPLVPSASGSSSYAADHLGHLANHPLRALPRHHTSDIHGPAAPFASALYSVGLVLAPAPSAGDSTSYAYAAEYSHRGGLVAVLDSTPTSLTALTPLLRTGTTDLRIDDATHASPDALDKARFIRDNVLYAFSFYYLRTIHRNMKDIGDVWYTGFKTFFILMMVVCLGMIGVGVMANTSTPVSANVMISAVMSRTSWILSSCLLLITISFFAGGHGFISGIIAALFIMLVLVSAWKTHDPTITTVVSTFFSSCLSKIKAGWRSRSQPILPM